jgi:xylulokinase
LSLLIAVDVGTTGARAAAVGLDGRVMHEVRRPYPTSTPRPSWAEQDPRDWADHAIGALAGLAPLLRSLGPVSAIGLTGQCPTVAPVDARGNPVGPGMIYRDNRAVAEAMEMRKAVGEVELHRRTGHLAEAFHIGPKILWLRRNAPDVFKATALFLQPRDVVLHRLTGLFATDQSHANATLLFDLRERAWAQDLFDRFGLDASLVPAALEPWTVAGELSASAARECGLPAGIPVVTGAADSQCAAFGASVWNPGPVSEMAGSSSCLNSAVLEPLADVRVTHYSHAIPDRFTTELGVNTTGAALDWAVSRLRFHDHAEMAAEAASFRVATHEGSPREWAPLFLPYLGDGERDDPTLRAGFVGLSDRHDRAALAYSVLEGVALAVRETLVVLQDAGSPLEELRVSGGGARLPQLGQIKANVLQRPVLHMDVDAATVGTALLAAYGTGLEAEAHGAVASIVGRARRFEPESGIDVSPERAALFHSLARSPAMHLE